MGVVILAAGNPSRGDDALGPLLLAELAALAPDGVTLVEDFQFQIEHALDLVGQDIALFIDAAASGAAPFCFAEIRPARSRAPSSHALSPDAVLQVYAETLGVPPPAFVLAVRGASFALGAPLSSVAQAHLEAARPLLAAYLAHPDVDAWRRLVHPRPSAAD